MQALSAAKAMDDLPELDFPSWQPRSVSVESACGPCALGAQHRHAFGDAVPEQHRDTEAMQLKLDELIRATQGAHNALMDLEELEERELDAFRSRYAALARAARDRTEDDEGVSGTPPVG